MSAISDFLSLARPSSGSSASDPPAPIQPSDDPSSYSEGPPSEAITARLGRENEVVRTFLKDTSDQLGVVADITDDFQKLTAALTDVLTALEHEKAESARTKGALIALRNKYDAMRVDVPALEKRHASLQSENDRLRREFEVARSRAGEIASERDQFNNDIANERAARATVEKQLSEETSLAQALTDENRGLADRAETLEKKAAASEVEVLAARHNLSAAEIEKARVATALDQALTETSQLSHQLAEDEKSLSEARSSLAQTKRRLGSIEAQRVKIVAAADMVTARRQNETAALQSKVDALQSESEAIDKLLLSTRESLIARSQELRVVEIRVFEADASRIKAEKKLERNAAATESWTQQVAKLQELGAELADKCRATTEMLATSEGWLIHAKEKIKSLTHERETLREATAINNTKFNEDLVQLAATLEHERCERALAEARSKRCDVITRACRDRPRRSVRFGAALPKSVDVIMTLSRHEGTPGRGLSDESVSECSGYPANARRGGVIRSSDRRRWKPRRATLGKLIGDMADNGVVCSEPLGQRLGQCGDGELLLLTQDRTDGTENCTEPGTRRAEMFDNIEILCRPERPGGRKLWSPTTSGDKNVGPYLF